MNCPVCGSENAPSARFCANCGTTLTRHCVDCQRELPAGSRFCFNCGTAVASAELPAGDPRFIRLAATAPAPLARKVRAASRLSGERRMVTALFMDVVGSRALEKVVGPAGWAELLDEAMERGSQLIFRYEGTIARLVGDELLAFFGAPVAHEDDPVRAVRAGLDMLEMIRQFAVEVQQRHDTDFAVRISLSSGPVTIGPVDQDLTYDYSALGGTVNLAAQIEATKQAMSVLVSEETYRFIRPFFDCHPVGQVPAAAASPPVKVYQVMAAKTNVAAARGIAGLVSPMVGRQAELDSLLQVGETVRAGLGRAVLIVAEPGMGKTRLVHEWRVAQSGLRWVEGASPSYGQGIAYTLITSLLRSLLAVPVGAGEPETRAALHSLLERILPDELPELFPYLGQLLGLKLDGAVREHLAQLQPQARQNRAIAALKKLLAAAADQSPLALVLEDLQWADPSSIELLTQFVPMAASAPILFCLVTRPDRNTPGWRLVTACRDAMGERLTELTLAPLSEVDSQRIITNLVTARSLPLSIRRLILRKAEGNPFFVEEVLRMLIDRGTLTQENGGWQLDAELETVEIPGSLQGLFLARSDHLSDEVKQTLRVASVIGRQFSATVLERVMGEGDSRAAWSADLSALETAGLIRVAQVKPELVYQFRHILLQEAVYASLLPADRRRLHYAVAVTMSQLYAANLAPYAVRLAHHFLEAGEGGQAWQHLFQAGQAALFAYANQEAETHYRRALELAQTTADRASTLAGLGRALNGQGRFTEAMASWQQAIEAYQRLANLDEVAYLYAQSARAAWSGGDTPAGLRLCQEGLDAIAGAPATPGVAHLLHEAARAHLFNGIRDEARRLGQQALAMAESLQAVLVQVEVLATLGLMSDQSPQDAQSALLRAIELAETAGLTSQAARAHINLAALLATKLPDLPAARDHYRQAASLHQISGNIASEILALGGMTSVMLSLGQFDQAEGALQQVEALAETLAAPGPGTVSYRFNAAKLLKYRGQLAEAAELLRAVQRDERQRGNLHSLLEADTLFAETALESCLLSNTKMLCSWEDVETALAEALEICEQFGAKSLLAYCLSSQARALQRDNAEARRLLALAKQQAELQPSRLDEGWLLLTEARVTALEGRWSQAQAAYEAAYETFARLEMRWWQARLLMALAESLVSSQESVNLERAQVCLQQSADLFAGMGLDFYQQVAETSLQAIESQAFAQVRAYQRASQELAQAGRIQAGFLPVVPTDLDGWQVAAQLLPTRQTSGDFYDFIPLPEEKLGIVIADVSDKGAAAALFMALCRSLVRTYATEFETDPGRVLRAANHRILTDTQTEQFVTLFYGILDLVSGELTFGNAGHNPPYLLRPGQSGLAATLDHTGIPLGIVDAWDWTSRRIQLQPGDTLVFYTDGITDANDADGRFFGQQRLVRAAQEQLGKPAAEIRDEILATVQAFVGGAPQYDDIALLVLHREPGR